MTKLQQVISYLKSINARYTYLETDQDAIQLVEDVIEELVTPDNWDESFYQFTRCYPSWIEYQRELDADRDLGNPYEF